MKSLILSWIKKFGMPTKGLGFVYAKNTMFVSIATILANIISFFIIIVLTRELGPEGLGQYSFIFGFMIVFFILADIGLSSLLTKDLSKDFSKVNKYVSNAFTLKLILNLIVFLIYFITLFYIGKPELFWLLLIVGVMQVFQIFFNFGNMILQVKMEGMKISLMLLLERFIALVGGIYVLSVHKSLTLFVLVLFLSNLIKSLLSWFFARKYFKFHFELDWRFLFDLIKKGFPFLLILSFALIYSRMDTIMLGFMKDYDVVGWYNAGYKLIDVLTIVPTMLLMFGFPMLSKLFVKKKHLAKKLFEKILFYSTVIVLPLIVGVFFIGDRILAFVYGFNSPESFIAFKILILALFFIYLTTIMGTLIASADRQNIFAWIAGFGALINIILNFILIPNYSLYGAGIATLITYVIMFILMYVYIMKEFFRFKLDILFPILVSICMGIILSRILFLNMFFIIVVCGLFYVICMIAIVRIKSLIVKNPGYNHEK